MATRKRYLFRCSGKLKYLENQLIQVNAVLSFDGRKIHDFVLYLNYWGQFFFWVSFFFWCVHLREDLKLFVLYTDMHWIFLCAYPYSLLYTDMYWI